MAVILALPGHLERRIAALFLLKKSNQTPEVMEEGKRIAATQGCGKANAYLASQRLTKQQLMELILEAGLTALER